jgi:MSHA biogenesis protein MshE
MTRKRVRLGDLLREKRLISDEQLTEALDEQRRTGRKLGRVLIDIGAVSEADLHHCLAEYLEIVALGSSTSISLSSRETVTRRFDR